LLQDVDTVYVGQPKVQNDQVRAALRGERQSLLAFGGG